MTFLAPGWIALAAVASLAVAAIHLIAWRLPRTVLLPTARFVPDEPARRAARTLRPSDLALLALRIAVLMLGGLALARPSLSRAPQGTAIVVAMERGADSTMLQDLRVDHSVFVVFDTTARIHRSAASAFADRGTGSVPASLSVGLLAAVREATALRRNYASVGIVLASSLGRGAFDAATQGIRDAWRDSIRIVRIPRQRSETRAQVELVSKDKHTDDPVMSGLRLARANGLLRGEVRVVREPATADDSTWASNGHVLVEWPQVASDATGRVGGVHAGDATAIGHIVPVVLGDTGRAVAWWLDGSPAAREKALGAGCIRTVGFDAVNAGDFVLSPSFQHLASELLGPCGGAEDFVAAPDSLIDGLRRAPRVPAASSASNQPWSPNRLAALLLVAAILLSIAEMAVRRQPTRAVTSGTSA
jgi:hypothetical protein